VALEERAVVCLGDNCIDRYLPPVDRLLIGGSVLNVAVALARRGLPAAYLGAVGDDRAGSAVLAALTMHGIDTSRVRVDDGQATAVTEIALEPGGERRFLRESYAIHEAYAPSEEDWEFLARARYVHASRLPHHLARLRALGRDGVFVSYDFSAQELPARLDGLELAFVPHEQLPPGADPAESARELVEHGSNCAVITLGAEGSLAATAFESVVVDAVPLASPVDTCGAGDAYIAAFIVSYLLSKPLEVCLEEGAAAGAEACSILGAFPQDPVIELALR
jgi:fructoselysine 6-kinase